MFKSSNWFICCCVWLFIDQAVSEQTQLALFEFTLQWKPIATIKLLYCKYTYTFSKHIVGLCEFKMASGPIFLWWPEVSSMQCTRTNSCVIIRLLVTGSPQSTAHFFTCGGRIYSLAVQSTISWVILWQIDHLLKLCPEKQFSNYN